MILPRRFKYYVQTRILYVDYGDGSVVRYFDVDPALAFLDSTNPRRNRDFFSFLESHPKSEIILGPAQQVGEPQTKPVFAGQQSEDSQTKLTYCIPWQKKPISNDGDL